MDTKYMKNKIDMQVYFVFFQKSEYQLPYIFQKEPAGFLY